jgi:hypothetical protein
MVDIEPIVLKDWVQIKQETYLVEIIKDVNSLLRITDKAK